MLPRYIHKKGGDVRKPTVVNAIDYLPAAGAKKNKPASCLALPQHSSPVQGEMSVPDHALSPSPGNVRVAGIKKLEADKDTASVQLILDEIEKRAFASGKAAAVAELATDKLMLETKVYSAIAALEKASQDCFVLIEPQVIALSLEIARKIMLNEALIDRFFIAGAVKLALERMRLSMPVTLVVAPEDHNYWLDFSRNLSSLIHELKIESDPKISAGMCICRTASSILDMGMDAQLAEVAAKFRELLIENQVRTPANDAAVHD